MNEYILELGKKAKEASKKLAIIDTNTKNAVWVNCRRERWI